MRTAIITALLACAHLVCHAQAEQTFKGTFDNKEYNIYLKINLYDKNIIVPQQEIFGEVDGFVGDYKDSRKWLITGSKLNKSGNATLSIINDYGSDDLKATLTYNSDKSFTLERIDGSPIRIVVNNAWVQLPKKLVFHMAKKQ